MLVSGGQPLAWKESSVLQYERRAIASPDNIAAVVTNNNDDRAIEAVHMSEQHDSSAAAARRKAELEREIATLEAHRTQIVCTRHYYTGWADPWLHIEGGASRAGHRGRGIEGGASRAGHRTRGCEVRAECLACRAAGVEGGAVCRAVDGP